MTDDKTKDSPLKVVSFSQKKDATQDYVDGVINSLNDVKDDIDYIMVIYTTKDESHVINVSDDSVERAVFILEYSKNLMFNGE